MSMHEIPSTGPGTLGRMGHTDPNWERDLIMPSKSPKQRRFMRAAANDPKFAKEAKIPQRVAREFVRADKAKARGSKKGK